MVFEGRQAINNHKQKFCINSKYSNLDSLEKEFHSASKHKNISLYGRKSLIQEDKILGQRDIDAEYRSLLREINIIKDRENKVQREKDEAIREIQQLDKIESQLMVEKKRNQLQDVIQRKYQLKREQEQLHKELQIFQEKKHSYDKSANQRQINHIDFQEGKRVGQVQMQRKMLQQQLNQIEKNINRKKRQFDKVKSEMVQQPGIYQPLYLQKSIHKQPSPYNSAVLGQQERSKVQPFILKNPKQQQHSNTLSKASERLLNQQHYPPEDEVLRNSKASSVSSSSTFLHPGQFNFNDKTLVEKVNPKGKSEEDLIIQSLIAQEYDDLNILARLPKGSQLYNVKKKQFEQISKIRTEMKQKAHTQRVAKIKRQFQYEKEMQQIQKDNQLWVDENRKMMLSKQTQLLQEPTQTQPIQRLNLNQHDNSNHGQQSRYMPTNHMRKPAAQSNQFANGYVPSISNRVRQRKGQIEMKSRKELGQELMKSKQQKRAIPYYDNQQKIGKVDDSMWGYKISVMSLKNYRRSKPIKFKVVVFEEGDKLGLLKEEFGTTYHDGRARAEFDPFNPTANNKFDEEGKIVFHQTFVVRTNLQALHNRNINQIFILFILAQKDESKITNQPTPYSWYCFKVTHFARIRQGKYTFNLYADDLNYPSDMNKMKKKLQEQLQIQLQQILLTNIPEKQKIPQKSEKPTQVTRNQPRQIGTQADVKPITRSIQDRSEKLPSEKSQTQLKHQPSERAHSAMSIAQGKKMRIAQSYKVIPDQSIHREQDPSKRYISNSDQNQFFKIDKNSPKNIDIMISQLRTLPSYTGPIKLEITYLDKNGSKFGSKQQILAELGNDMYNPEVRYVKQLRNEKNIPLTTIIFIRLLAISTLDYEPYVVGFTFLNLFFDELGSPITNSKNQDAYVCECNMQLPLFWGNIEPQYCSMSTINEEYPIIPAASLLLGVARNRSNVSNQMPPYASGTYNTNLYPIDELEMRFLEAQYQRQLLDTNQVIKGYLKYKGIKKDYSGSEVRKYIEKTLTFPNERMQVMNLNPMGEYSPNFGIFFTVDRILIPEGFKQYYYYFTVCISPPASYYHRQNFDLSLGFNIDPVRSSQKELIYEDDNFYFQPVYNQNASIILEINRIKIIHDQDFSEDLIQGYAYIIVPLFDLTSQVKCVNAMKNSIQMLSGALNLNQIKDIEGDLIDYLQTKSNTKLSNVSLEFRITNGFFPGQFRANQQKQPKKNFASLLPKERSFKQIRKNALSIINDYYSINIS